MQPDPQSIQFMNISNNCNPQEPEAETAAASGTPAKLSTRRRRPSPLALHALDTRTETDPPRELSAPAPRGSQIRTAKETERVKFFLQNASRRVAV